MADFGEALRQQRETRGVSLEEISAATRISVRLLQAIENEDFDRLPGGVFNVNFVRQYARHVGLDEERVVSDFRRLSAPPETAAPAPAKVAGYEWDRPASALARLWIPATFLIIIAAGGLLLWIRAQLTPRAAATPASAVAQTKAPAPAVSQPPAAAPAVQTPAPAAPTPTPDAAEAALRVELVANAAVWVEAVADGRSVLDAILQPQETRLVTANSLVRLRVGNAAALQLKLNGQPQPPIGGKGHVATLEVTREGVRTVFRKPDPPAAEPKAEPKESEIR